MRLAISLITLGIVVSGQSYAKHWHEDQDDQGFDHRDHHARNCYFQPHDARVITQYYAPRGRELPPGLQKRLYRNGQLPPGWERRMQPLPVVVERQLVAVPSGYSRGYIDGYAVVYSPRTHVVIDIVGVFGR